MWLPRPYYAAQLAAGVGNIPIVEGIPGTARGIDTSAYQLRNGELVMPDAPGFGLTLV
jgi:L-alanine-DL-glutamate epimerase-like enolase superfamily enzyme